ncbi:MAG: ABC transporter ATP-binding protein [Chloroflexi bacterium]|nr:ABC transporter ATP-binding protein [Chloroflexota bacterium]
MTAIDVELKHVVKEFAGRRKENAAVKAVDDVSLQINKGEFFALLGPSGCGKTTTLRMIAGFEDVSRGEILIRGKQVQGVPPFHRPVNTVFQDYALFPHMSVLQNVMFGLQMEGVTRTEAKQRAIEALELVQLPHTADRKPRELSGGQQQRIALARALVKRPTVLLLDEPLGALDLKLRKAMQFELKEMQLKLGITFIYVTHDQEEALTMADRIAVMNLGKVLQVGTPEDIYERPHTRFVADFIGETNFIKGRLCDRAGTRGQIELPSGDKVGAVLDDPAMPVGSEVTVAIRPEKLTLKHSSGTNPAHDSGTTLIPCKLQQSVYIGTDTRHVVNFGYNGSSAQLVVRTQNFRRTEDLSFSSGEDVYVYWVDENARVLVD